VPEGKYLKVAYVHKNVPRIIECVAAWSGFLLLIGAGALVLGMAIRSETLA
jgi:hypothetical protein